MNVRKSKLRIAVVTAALAAVIAGGIVTWHQMKTSDPVPHGTVSQEPNTIEEYEEAQETSGTAEGTLKESKPETSAEPSAESSAKPSAEPETEETNKNESETAEIDKNEGNPSDENSQTVPAEPSEDPAKDSSETTAAVESVALNFDESTVLELPVSGSVMIPYNMENTVYFQTLDQYRCNPGVVFSVAVGTPVKAVANSQVLTVEEDAQTGKTITMDMGNGYQAVYGQLQDVTLLAGQQVQAGTVIGTIAEPTKYYSREGSNLFFELTKDGETLDPMMYLPPMSE